MRKAKKAANVLTTCLSTMWHYDVVSVCKTGLTFLSRGSANVSNYVRFVETIRLSNAFSAVLNSHCVNHLYQGCFIKPLADVTLFVFMVATSFAVSNGAHIARTDVTSNPVTSLPSLHNLTSLELTNTTQKHHTNGMFLGNSIQTRSRAGRTVTRLGLF